MRYVVFDDDRDDRKKLVELINAWALNKSRQDIFIYQFDDENKLMKILIPQLSVEN